MDLSNLNYVDLGAFGLLVLSGIFAFRRGFVKEIFALGTWVVASIIAAKYYPALKPWMMNHHIKNDLAAEVASVVSLFCLTLVVLIPTGNFVAGLIKGPTLTSLDHSLGLAFGLLRGFLVLCLLFLCLTWIWPKAEEQPDWMTTAKIKPMLSYGADMLRSFIPKDEEQQVADDLAKSRDAAEKAMEDAQHLDQISTPVPAAGKNKEMNIKTDGNNDN